MGAAIPLRDDFDAAVLRSPVRFRRRRYKRDDEPVRDEGAFAFVHCFVGFGAGLTWGKAW